MKKLITVIALVFSLFVRAQDNPPSSTYTPINTTGYDELRMRIRALHLPTGGATPTLAPKQWLAAGAVIIDTINNKLYLWSSGGWHDITGAGGAVTGSKSIAVSLNNVTLVNDSTILVNKSIYSWDGTTRGWHRSINSNPVNLHAGDHLIYQDGSGYELTNEPPEGGCTRLIDQITVSKVGPLQYYASPGNYKINCVPYYWPGGSITLSIGNAGSGEFRKDFLILKTTGLDTLKGENSTGGVGADPVVNTDTQIFLTGVRIDENETDDSQITDKILWHEGYGTGDGFWTRTATIDSLYTGVTAYEGTHSVRFFGATNGQYFQINNRFGDTLDKSDYSNLQLFYNNVVALNTNRTLNITLRLGNAQAPGTNSVNIGNWGHIKGTTGQWLPINIPTSAFGGSSKFTAIRITDAGVGGTPNTLFDKINWQVGVGGSTTQAAFGNITGNVNDQTNLRDTIRTKIIGVYRKPGTDSVFNKFYNGNLVFAYKDTLGGGSSTNSTLYGNYFDYTFTGTSLDATRFAKVNGAATYTQSAKMTMTGGNGSADNNQVNSLDTIASNNWDQEFYFTLVNKFTSYIAQGKWFGEKSVNSAAANFNMYPFISYGGSSSLMMLKLNMASGSGNGTSVDSSKRGIAMADGNTYKLLVSRRQNQIVLRLSLIVSGKEADAVWLFYKSSSITQLLPNIGVAAFGSLDAVSTVDVTRWRLSYNDYTHADAVIIGTSITQGYGPNSVSNSWPEQSFRGQPMQWVNLGQGGNMMSDVIASIPRAMRYNPRYVILEVGINDAAVNIRAGLQRIYDSLVVKYGVPVSNIVIVKTFTVAAKDSIYTNWCALTGISLSDGGQLINTVHTIDGTHPDDKGNIMQATVNKAVRPDIFGAKIAPDLPSLRYGMNDVTVINPVQGDGIFYDTASKTFINSNGAANFIKNDPTLAITQSAGFSVNGFIDMQGHLSVGGVAPSVSIVAQFQEAATAGNGIRVINTSNAGTFKFIQLGAAGTSFGLTNFDNSTYILGYGNRFIVHSYNDLSFATGSSYLVRATIDQGGNLNIGGLTAPTSLAGGISLYNGTAATANISGVSIYSVAGEAVVRDGAGNATTFSPHNFKYLPYKKRNPHSWAYTSEKNGEYVSADMYDALKTIEKLSADIELLKGLIIAGYKVKKAKKIIYTGKIKK